MLLQIHYVPVTLTSFFRILVAHAILQLWVDCSYQRITSKEIKTELFECDF